MPVFLRWILDLTITNPIAVRLVQGGSKRTRHMYIRAGYLAVVIIVLMAQLLAVWSGSTNFRELAAAGASSFEYVAYLQLGLICVLAPVFMAGAIATESNPKTWDILLTTPMSSAQIVIGQLMGRLFFILALLVSTMPLFALTQYFGGVPGSSVLLSYLVAAGAATIVGAIAIGLAVNRLAGRRAVFTFYIAVITYIAMTFVADKFFLRPASPAVGGGEYVTWLTPLNPFLALEALLNPSNYRVYAGAELAEMGAFAQYWLGSPVRAWAVVSLGLSVLIVGASAINVRNLGSKTGVPWYKRITGKQPSPTGERYRKARTVGHNPIAWREASARQATISKAIARWSFLAAGGLFGVGIVVAYHTGALDGGLFRQLLQATVWTELIIIGLVAINTSATAISREREDGTLDLLLTTPITPKEYLGGKLLGLVMYLVPLLLVPLGTVAAASIYALFGGFGAAHGATITTNQGLVGSGTVDLPVVLPEAAILMPIVSIAFMAFCVMIGLQRSLQSKGTISSVVFAVIVVGAVGGIIGACGWNAGANIPVIGPVLSAFNPVSLMYACVDPAWALNESMSAGTPQAIASTRITLAIGAVIAALAYFGIVMGMRTAMTNSFDTATRKLAGTG